MDWFAGFGGLGGSITAYASTTAFWIGLMIFILLLAVILLKVRKGRRLNKVVIEMYDLGDGRAEWKTSKGGWFKSKFTFGGLWDYGSEIRFRLKDMTPVDNVSHNDYRLFNGKPALFVIRNPNDPKMVYPITKCYLSKASRSMLNEVAPADYRDSAEKAIEQADLEMQSKWQQYGPLIVLGAIVMVSLIITLLNTQYGKYMVDKATEILKQAQTSCSSIASSAP